MISGVVVKPTDKIFDERGFVQKMIQSNDAEFNKFGEVYFSAAFPGIIKGWHFHKKMTMNYTLIVGQIKLVLYDNRSHSKTKNKVAEFVISDKKPCLVTIPPKIWIGFKNLGKSTAIIANLTDFSYDPEEIERIDPKKNTLIKYDWDK